METEDEIFESLYRYTQAIAVALGHRDLQTRLHSERVCALSAELGRSCGLTAQEMCVLRIGASLHDVGKIGVKDVVLGKPGELDADEWVQMKQHSEIGESIIMAIDFPTAREASKVIRHHHEHFDGSGYPDGLAGEQIPLISRIISIADSYDAMAVTRSYHHQRCHKEILEVLSRESGIKHDPKILEVFFRVIEASAFKVA